jgi:hypothetical protein
MQSILMAVSDFLASLFHQKSYKAKVKPVVEDDPMPGYAALYFKCWLCDGKTDFAYKKTTTKRAFTIECCRCGVDNLVTVEIQQ